MSGSRDTIAIRALEVQCIVGLHPHERVAEQTLSVDLELHTSLRRAGCDQTIRATVDYDVVAREVTALLRFRRFELLEAAVEEVAAMILGVHTGVHAVTVTIDKLRALCGRARSAAVRIHRTQADYPRQLETQSFGLVEVLLESRTAGLYLLHVEAGREIPAHIHRIMLELEWLVAGELTRNGETLSIAEPMVWRHGQVHRYNNASANRATLFCCDVPPFIASDEITVRPLDG